MTYVHPKDRLTTANPKCFTCKFWLQHKSARTWGECTDPDNAVIVDEAIARHVTKIRLVPDLGLCSNWLSIE
jgi:hypothetical protein